MLFRSNANATTEVEWEHLIHLLEHRKGILDAVVFSGGEPLMQKGLAQAMDTVKAMGFEVGMHTGGYNPEALRNVIDKVMWIGFDIKAPFEEAHYKRATGGIAQVEKVKESLGILLASGVHFECRTTVIRVFCLLRIFIKLLTTFRHLELRSIICRNIGQFRAIKLLPTANAKNFSAMKNY